MAARSIASLTVSFGLVAIPVKLYTATEAKGGISFNFLHKACGSRVKQQYFCARENIPIAREDMVKGYEFAKDQYVMFTPEELKALEEAGTHSADITEFVPISAIDPVYFDKAYYLAPDKGGAKPYALLAKALRESERCAIGHWAARGKSLHRDDPPGRGRPGDAAAAVRQRSARDQRDRHPQDRRQACRAQARAAADRRAEQQHLRSGRVQGRRRRARRGRGAAEGRGRGDHAWPRSPKAARRSSTSWKRCVPAWRRRAAAPARKAAAGTARPARKPAKQVAGAGRGGRAPKRKAQAKRAK